MENGDIVLTNVVSKNFDWKNLLGKLKDLVNQYNVKRRLVPSCFSQIYQSEMETQTMAPPKATEHRGYFKDMVIPK